MSIISTLATSRRGYLSRSELSEYADINITDTDEADDQISQAEELIDAYVGPQDRFLDCEIVGPVVAVSSNTFTLYSQQQNMYEKNYFRLCEVEIISGTGAGQRRKITDSTKAGVCTLDTTWTTTPDTTSYYRIYQLGKFPRYRDVHTFSDQNPIEILKFIPEPVKRAVAAQVQFYIEMGSNYFSTDQSEKTSETIGDYSYTNGGGGSGSSTGGISKLISPKARSLLNGIKRRTGVLIAN